MAVKELYHIFNVFSYKGGELRSHINRTKEEAFTEIYDDWIDELICEDTSSYEEILNSSDEEILNALSWCYDNYNEYYACDGMTQPEVYKNTKDGLELVEFTDEELVGLARQYIIDNEEFITELIKRR